MTAAAVHRLTSTMNRWRGTRSTNRPASGPNSEGRYMHAIARPARALLPVRDFTQMPATRLSAVSPIRDSPSPARYRRALRRSAADPRSSRRATESPFGQACDGVTEPPDG